MRPVTVAVLAAAACTLAACTSSAPSPSSSSASSTPSTPVVSSAPATVVPVTSAVPSTAATTPKTTSAAPSTTARTASTPSVPLRPTFTTTCRSLTVDVVRGGAIRGMEIAAMQFTNTGSATCTVTGAPTATLLRNGVVVGTPSQPNNDPVRPFTLKPGEIGESLLRDFSTCNAPLSDTLRLREPSRNGVKGARVSRPIELRACKLEAAPVREPS